VRELIARGHSFESQEAAALKRRRQSLFADLRRSGRLEEGGGGLGLQKQKKDFSGEKNV